MAGGTSFGAAPGGAPGTGSTVADVNLAPGGGSGFRLSSSGGINGLGGITPLGFSGGNGAHVTTTSTAGSRGDDGKIIIDEYSYCRRSDCSEAGLRLEPPQSFDRVTLAVTR